MQFLIRLFGILLAITVLGITIAIVKIASYNQSEDSVHLAAKQNYLESLEKLPKTAEHPNIVVILLDDLGYGDVGAYGSQSIRTPHIDSLAAGGMRFSHYYSPSSVCSPSRAAMMTGRYPPRTGLGHVVFPEEHFMTSLQKLTDANTAIPTDEIMLSEVLRAAGYNTGMVGKWHMGDSEPSLPNNFGFDHYYGALYSNDMKPFALYRDEKIEEPAELDQTRLNALYTREVVDFVERQNSETPFFLYYAHNFPHVPLFSSAEQAGKSDAGLYGDVVEDVDHSIGALLQALERKGFIDNTLIIFTSDNGPWFQGNPGFTRGRKTQTWEGGQRVPFIAQWPNNIPAGTENSTPISGIDLLPTVLALLDLPLPADRVIDGVNISGPLMSEEPLDERPLYYFSRTGEDLHAVRDNRFKYHRQRGVMAIEFNDNIISLLPKGPWLFDLSLDPQESYDVSNRYPEAKDHLRQQFEEKSQEMEVNQRGWLPN
ncbi:MAG: sulfatase [Halioglobus sp.]|nr:sulfatase [Halioglobus sp.]